MGLKPWRREGPFTGLGDWVVMVVDHPVVNDGANTGEKWPTMTIRVEPLDSVSARSGPFTVLFPQY